MPRPSARRLRNRLAVLLVLASCGAEPPADARAPESAPAADAKAPESGGRAGTTAGSGLLAELRGTQADRYDTARDVAVDASGHIVVVGATESADFPTTAGAHQTRLATGGTSLGSFPGMDVFVTKLRPDGTIAWSTLLGGPNYDRAYAVEVDARGDIYIGGRAGAGFPTTPGTLQTEFAGDRHPNRGYGPQDGFVAKFSSDGALLWSTYLGNDEWSFVRDIDVDAEGRVHAALSGSGRFPTVRPGAWQPDPGGDADNAIARLAPDGSRVEWATHLGRDEHEGNPSIRVDAEGRVFVATSTRSDGLADTDRAFQVERAGLTDVLIVRLSSEGAFERSTYLGGSGADITETHNLSLDPQGRPVIAIATTSHDLPLPADVTPYRATHGESSHDGYAAVLSADLDALLGATYLGNAGEGGGFEGVAVYPDGSVAFGGVVGGGIRPTKDALQTAFGGRRDALLAKFSPRLDRALYLSYWGGTGHDDTRAIALGPAGVLVAAGHRNVGRRFEVADVIVLRVTPP